MERLQPQTLAVAGMVERVERAIAGAGVRDRVKYSDRVRRLEVTLDAAPADRFGAELERVEEAWMVEIAKARRAR